MIKLVVGVSRARQTYVADDVVKMTILIPRVRLRRYAVTLKFAYGEDKTYNVDSILLMNSRRNTTIEEGVITVEFETPTSIWRVNEDGYVYLKDYPEL